eukprot:9881294-Alexandrium_andersonii.AAC.1
MATPPKRALRRPRRGNVTSGSCHASYGHGSRPPALALVRAPGPRTRAVTSSVSAVYSADSRRPRVPARSHIFVVAAG